jgi:hypothetical protein
MKILISIITTFGFISAIIGVIFLLITLIKKMLYYPPNIQKEVSEKIDWKVFSDILKGSSIYE